MDRDKEDGMTHFHQGFYMLFSSQKIPQVLFCSVRGQNTAGKSFNIPITQRQKGKGGGVWNDLNADPGVQVNL